MIALEYKKTGGYMTSIIPVRVCYCYSLFLSQRLLAGYAKEWKTIS